MSMLKPALAVAAAAFFGALLVAAIKSKLPAVGKFLP